MVCSHLLRCRLLGLLLLLCWGSSLWAQDYYRAEEPSRCDSSGYTDRLGIRLLGQGFFRNNEYATELADDYTLPGYRLRLDVGYSPDTRLPVQLRLGVANLYYWGASRYPAALAYQDLPYWRGDGDRYTKFRLLPFFQATILPTPRLALILGNLEGGVKHNLIDPLYDPELNLTADEERGFQLNMLGSARRWIRGWTGRASSLRGRSIPRLLSSVYTFAVRYGIILRVGSMWICRRWHSIGVGS